MQKISSFTTAMVVFLMFFTSCTNEELLPHEPVWDQGRIVFNVNTGKNVVCTRAPEENEQAIRSLGVFIVKPDGNLAEGITRFYEAKALTDKKLAVSIPVDIMETPGIKAYLVANGPDKTQCDGLKTEQELLDLAAVIKPEEIGTKGIPMASGAISLNFTGGIATVDANMKRVMSTLCAKVVKSKGVVVGPSDFTFKVHGVSLKEGYCFKDECKDTGVDQVWNSTSKSQDEEVSLGYFYQSKAFQVEVVSQSAGQSRTIEIPLEKAQTRNKKYVLKIHPKPASEGKGEFTVTVEAWEETETDVDFDKLSIKKDLPADKFEIQNDGIRLLTNNYHETDFCSPKDWFVLKEGTEIVNVKLEGTIDEKKRGVDLDEKGIARATPQPNQTDLSGKIMVTMKNKNRMMTIASIGIHIPHALICWNDKYAWKSTVDKSSCKVENGEFIYTNPNNTGVETKFSIIEGFDGIAKPMVFDHIVYLVAAISPLETSGESLQNGLLYDIHGKQLPIDQASFGFRRKSAAVVCISLKCSKEDTYVGYIKITLKNIPLNTLTTQILKIKFKFD